MADIKLSLDEDLKRAAKVKAARYDADISKEFQEFLKNDFLGDGVDPEKELTEARKP